MYYTDMEKVFESPRGRFRLARHREGDHPSLQAWDAADEFLLSSLAEEKLDPAKPLLVVNDTFGALSTALHEFRPVLAADSFLTFRTAARNLKANGIPENHVSPLAPFGRPPGDVSACILKIPKSLSLLDTELRWIGGLLPSGAPFFAGGMIRDIHLSTLRVIEKRIGPARTSRGWKKARLVFARREEASSAGGDQGRDVGPRFLVDGATGLKFALYGGVFSQRGIDAGTRLLADFLPEGDYGTVIDLGCGSGILGLAAAKKYPRAGVFLVDESFLAVESARRTFRENRMEHRGRFVWGNRLESFPDNHADLILCNPPFHQNRAVSLSSAMEMFRDSARVLKPGGELRLVANAHLGYHAVLRNFFPLSTVIGGNKKFLVFSCVKK